jgi:20S proteasome alpha/beta subunit
MSTLIGIKTNYGIERIVLGSDRQFSDYDEDDKMVEKGDVQKIFCGKKWAIAYCGGGEIKELRRFFGVLRGDKRYGSSKKNADEILEKAVNEKNFSEVCELNRFVAKKDRSTECTYEFILGSNYPKLGMWQIDSYGNLLLPSEDNEFEYIAIGSGADEAEKYIKSVVSEGKIGEHEFDKDSVTSSVANRIAKRAIQAARSDASTGFGYDIVFISKGRSIEAWGDRIKKKMFQADREIEDEISAHFDSLENDD